MIRNVLLLAVLTALAGHPAMAQEGWRIGGFVASELRVFPNSPIHEGQSAVFASPSVLLQPEFRYDFDQQNRLTFIPMARLESGAYDPNRNHGDIREMNFTSYHGNWFAQAGLIRAYWGKTESRHLVDVINQSDAVDNVDRDDKLGQPALVLGGQSGYGSLTGYALPGFREGTFPGRQGRLRGPFPVDTGKPVYDSDKKWRRVDWAGRYSHTMGPFDFAVSHFHGTSREARVTLGADAAGKTVLVPHYDLINQTSVEFQVTLGALLLKGEGYRRSGNPKPYCAHVSGFEYTLFSVFQSNHDIGLLAEYVFDNRNADAPPTSFDREIFLGVRWVANDAEDTDLLAGTLIDARTGSKSYSAEFKTRLTDHLKLKLRGQIFQEVSPTERILYSARKDDNIIFHLAYYF